MVEGKETYDQVTNYLETIIFFSEKIIVGPQEGEIPPPLAQMVLTQCISISELLVYPLVAKFSNMCYFHPLLRCPQKT